MMVYLGVFAASFGYVFLKAAQQHNVLKYRYGVVWPFSLGMAATEVFIVSQIAIHLDPMLVIPMGIGGALGSNAAMYMNQRWMGEGND